MFSGICQAERGMLRHDGRCRALSGPPGWNWRMSSTRTLIDPPRRETGRPHHLSRVGHRGNFLNHNVLKFRIGTPSACEGRRGSSPALRGTCRNLMRMVPRIAHPQPIGAHPPTRFMFILREDVALRQHPVLEWTSFCFSFLSF